MSEVDFSSLREGLGAEHRRWLSALVPAVAARGGALYFVGGPVRDALLGRPVRDVDVVVEGLTSEATREAVEGAADPSDKVVDHPRFGTLRIRGETSELDVVVARRESYPRAGSLPRVEAGTLEDDLRRRDFSINAMALRIGRGGRLRSSGLVDPFEGRKDLAAKRLRALHPQSFHDDPTRALRAARFAARLDFPLARSTRGALRDAIRDGAVGQVSGDRIRREFEKAFEDARVDLCPAAFLRQLARWDVLPALEPGLELPTAAIPALRRLGRFRQEPGFAGPRYKALHVGLSLWLAPVATGLRKRTLERLSVRGEAAERIHGFGRKRERWARDLARTRGRGGVDALLADASEEELVALHSSATQAVRRRVERFAGEDRHRKLPVGGKDLLDLGLEGPALGRALARVRAAFLDGDLANREEALALAAEVARGRGGRRAKTG